MQFVLQATDVVKQYGVKTVLDKVCFQVYEGDKIGIVGRNGSGKSTLLGILSGETSPDSGSVERKLEPVFLRQFEEEDSTLSGGEKQKRRILEQMKGEGLILFADEPTANLDRQGVEWVRRKLESASTLVLVSHDRELLDAVCTRIVEIREGSLTEYRGNFSDYEAELERKKQNQELRRREYRIKKAQLEAAIQGKEQKVARQRQKKRREYATNLSEARLGGHKRKASMQKQERQAQVLLHRLERLETVEAVKEPAKIHLDFSLTQPPGNRYVIQGKGVSFSYGEKPIFREASFTVPRGERVALCGPNGCGKSTLLRLILEGWEGISTAPKLRMGLLNQDFGQIDPEKSVLDNALSHSIQSRDAVRSTLAGLLFRGEEVFQQAGVLSGGEKMRLGLAMLLLSPVNCLLLDEPTNYLDIPSLEAVREAVKGYPGTLLLVSHDSRFVEEVATRRLFIRDHRIVEEEESRKKPPSPAPSKMLLELRRTRLVAEISSAPPEEKDRLEEEYRRVLEELRRL